MTIKNTAKSLIVNPSGMVLLLVRSKDDDDSPGRYDFPGGGIAPNEDFASAAARETTEETGINIPKNQFKLVYAGTSISNSGNTLKNRLMFLAHAQTSEVTLSHEHESFEWVTLEDAISKFDHAFYGPGMKIVLENNLHLT